ncbi:hypothetical protein EDD85DRAFT_808920 [Armillaria nabsnona]|nr:hypothetical protein EDD85DRAFT_808920 [Armillaria nabsnona]
MPSHPAILSIRDAFRRASLKTEAGAEIPDLPEFISGLDTKKGIKENVTVTLDDVGAANKVAVAVRGYFASYDPKIKCQVYLITKMYHTAVESTYYNATFFCKSESRNASTSDADGISNGDLASVRTAANNAQTAANNAQTTANNAQTTANNAQTTADRAQITADNAQIAHQNSHRRYTENFSALKKVKAGSGFGLASQLYPEYVKENRLKDTPNTSAPVGDIPPEFKDRIAAYSKEDIFTMIVFYNSTFNIESQDELPARINKFRSFLSGYYEM